MFVSLCKDNEILLWWHYCLHYEYDSTSESVARGLRLATRAESSNPRPSTTPLSCDEQIFREMPSENLYTVLQGILETIEPENCAIIFSYRSTSAI